MTADPVLEAIERVRRLLSGPRADAREVAAELEKPAEAVQSVNVVAVPGSDDVSHVDLELRDPARVRTLRDAYGEPGEPPRVDWDRPRTLVFRLPAIALIARLERDDEESVRTVTLRRDV